MKKNFVYWVVASFILVVIFGSIYGVGQFILRAGANDPQVQLAEDAALQIDSGISANTFNTAPVNMENSLAPFVIVYDGQGRTIAGNGYLNGRLATIPKGVLDHAKPSHRITWQPADEVRIAAVVQATSRGYVVSGRNLREAESREDTILILTGIGGLVSELAVTGLLVCREKGFPIYGKTTKTSKSAKK